jgi:hypothetical protein
MVEVSTIINDVTRKGGIEYDRHLHAFISHLEADSSLFQPEKLRERLIALDDLDARFGGFDSEGSTSCTDSRIHKRAKAIQIRLEAANAGLHQSVRSDQAQRGNRTRLLPCSFQQGVYHATEQE